MFSSGMIIAAGTTIGVVLLEKFAEECGIMWLGLLIKMALPIIAMITINHFFMTNPILRWLK